MTARIDKAMVLAAGLGTRMAPASGVLPKPLVRLGGAALIDRVLDRIAAAGIREAVVNVHHKADQIETHLAGRSSLAVSRPVPAHSECFGRPGGVCPRRLAGPARKRQRPLSNDDGR